MTSPKTTLVRQATQPFGKDIAALTSLRFFAAFAVVLYHFRTALPFDADVEFPFLGKGHLAVDFFFLLSGFILSHVYLASVERGTFSPSGFILKRFARLYPVHFATLLAYVLLMYAYRLADIAPKDVDRYDVAAIPANLLMVHAWGLADKLTFNYPSWSISAEWFVYLLFALLAYAIVRTKVRPAILFAVAVATFAASWMVADWALSKRLTTLHWDFGILRIVPEFLLGVAAYRLGSAYDVSRRAARLSVLGSVGGILLGAFLGFSDLFLVALFWTLILGAAVHSRNGDRGLLEHPVLVYLGEISYSTYMVHALCFTLYFNGLERILGPATFAELALPLWFGSLPVVIAASALSYRLIEVPGRKFITELPMYLRMRVARSRAVC